VSEALKWKPHGIFVVQRPEKVPDLMKIRGVPLVLVDQFHDHPRGISRIEIDNEGVGRNAARYFLQNYFEHFAVVLWPGNPGFSAYRERGFTKELHRNKFDVSSFEVEHFSEQPWHENPQLDRWLQQLPKPVAVYCVQDMIAQRILERCRGLGIRVPTEVSVLGTDNSPLICESNRPFISSMPQPLEQAGFEAAAMLEKKMKLKAAGKPFPVTHKLIPVGDAVERQSSSLRAIPDPNIAQAADLLRNLIIQGGTISDAAREVGITRRTLERGFMKYMGVTPGVYVRGLKIAHAKKLLVETDLRMWEIAKACRMTQEHFTMFFREEAGVTPSTYRRTRKHPISS
jgi:LacI family transcriptional regulator